MISTVLVAGATGMLGSRIAAHLLDEPDVAVRLLVRPTSRSAAVAAALDALVARGQSWSRATSPTRRRCIARRPASNVLSMITLPPFPASKTENERYPDARPTGLRDYLEGAHRALAAA